MHSTLSPSKGTLSPSKGSTLSPSKGDPNLERIIEQIADALLQHQARIDSIAYRVAQLQDQVAELTERVRTQRIPTTILPEDDVE